MRGNVPNHRLPHVRYSSMIHRWEDILARFLLMLLLASAAATPPLFARTTSEAARHKGVAAMRPVGYWPADEGEGTVLHDRSGNGNHGAIRSVPWRDGFLVFDNDFYQWIEVPHNPVFSSKTFAMGGWVYHRFDKNPQNGSRPGAILIGHPFEANGKWDAIWGDTLESGTALLQYYVPSKGGEKGCVEIVSGKKQDVLETRGKVSIPHSTWQHVIYSYDGDSGHGVLYLNGKMVKEGKVPHQPANTPLVIGAGRWGTFNIGGNVSMDGTLSSMVFFDRALDASEVQQLYKLTQPAVKPTIEPYSQRYKKRRAWLQTAVMAKGITRTENNYTVSQLIGRVRDRKLDDFARGQAAIQLAFMGENAKDAIPVLVEELQEMTDKDGAHLPQIEEFFRNSLIRALLDIDRDDARAKPILARAFIQPLFNRSDTSQSGFDKIRPLIEAGKWAEALQAYRAHMRALSPVTKRKGWGTYVRMEEIDEVSRSFPLGTTYFDGYLTCGVPYLDAGYSAYSLVDNRRDGTSYTTLLEKVPFDVVMQCFDRELKNHTEARPERKAKNALGNDPKLERQWHRLKIIKITPDGKRQESYLHGDWFIFDGRDEKMYGWSVISDEKGYIHLFGGQHNSPKQDNCIPGSWERLGIAHGESRPAVMYWVSKKPSDITGFEFVGQKNNPRKVSGKLNYMNFARSRGGQVFLYGRGDAWTWILHRYDSGQRRWIRIKGSARDMMAAAKRNNPKWVARLGNTKPRFGPADGLVVAWQPFAYNFCRTWPNLVGEDIRGVSFDLAGRMHLSLALLGVLENGEVAHRPDYAYSDDNGTTFYAADGKRLTLPLTHNPIPDHNADRTREPARSHFEVWVSLVREYQ